MREIDLYEVGMENYGPYIDPMILPFKNDNITLLTGPNGVGKTMALDAIPFTSLQCNAASSQVKTGGCLCKMNSILCFSKNVSTSGLIYTNKSLAVYKPSFFF